MSVFVLFLFFFTLFCGERDFDEEGQREDDVCFFSSVLDMMMMMILEMMMRVLVRAVVLVVLFLVLDGTDVLTERTSVTHTRTYYCAKTTDDASPEESRTTNGVFESPRPRRKPLLPRQGA